MNIPLLREAELDSKWTLDVTNPRRGEAEFEYELELGAGWAEGPFAGEQEYVPSNVRIAFESAVRARHWRTAFLNLNGLNMLEMLRSLDGLDPYELYTLWAKRDPYRFMVNMPRIEYAVIVVVYRVLPPDVGDLRPTGQVGDATDFIAEKVRTSAYNRHAALTYARLFWNIACSDGFIAGSFPSGPFTAVPIGTNFVHATDSSGASLGSEFAQSPNRRIIPWAQLDDCTHFISCCIGRPPSATAGGLDVAQQFAGPPTGPYGIVTVEEMLSFLQRRKLVEVKGRKSKDKSLITQLQTGDVVAYFNPTRQRHTHLAMYLGNGKIICHTYCRSDLPACRWDNDWNLGEQQGFSWTFLRLKS
jgi:Putative amidase domain